MVLLGVYMKGSYLFEYVNENEFRKYERSLKKYYMLAYKKLYFLYYPSFKKGEFSGEIVATNDQNNSKNYELKLPTDIMSSKVHGDIKLHYTVYFNEKIVMLDKITPEDILEPLKLPTYKEKQEIDMFKLNLLKMLSKESKKSQRR